MRQEIIILETPAESLRDHAIRACAVAQATGHEVTFQRSNASLVVYPHSYFIDIERLVQAQLDYKSWKIDHSKQL